MPDNTGLLAQLQQQGQNNGGLLGLLQSFMPQRSASQYPGLLEQGNIDLNNRPKVPNGHGYSTVRSASFNLGGKEVLLPTVTDDGRILDERTPEGKKEIIDTYVKTGKHLGKFDTPDNATAYAISLHGDQAKLYDGKR